MVESLPRLAPAIVVLALVTAACAQPRREPERVAAVRTAPAEPRAAQTGTASWYGQAHHGKKTASGEMFDMHALTAAHRTLPLGTRVLVTNLGNGRAVEVRINDRGPAVPGRILDVSYAAARALGAVGDGVFRVRIAVLE
jgi:rare lipoprotein A